jgi:hypothetical protein
MDKDYEDRVRKMVPNPVSTWPAFPVLHMKRFTPDNTGWAEFGTMVYGDLAPGQYIVRSKDGKRKTVFTSLDDLIAAGWTVD